MGQKLTSSPLNLGDLEIATLEALWSSGESDARSLHARIGKLRGISLSTMQSTLERLHRKGLLHREKISHAYVYTPAESRDIVMAKIVSAALQRFGSAPREGLLAAFAGYAADADEEALAELEAMIAARKQERGDAS